MYEVSGLFTKLERTRKLEQQRDQIRILLLSANDGKEKDQLNSEIEKINDRLEKLKNKVILPNLFSVSGDNLSSFTDIEVSEGFRRILENKVRKGFGDGVLMLLFFFK